MGWLHDQGIPTSELERLDWTQIAPLMDRQYDIYNAGKEGQNEPQEGVEKAPAVPPGYRATYNERGEYTLEAVSDYFAGRPEYWAENKEEKA